MGRIRIRRPPPNTYELLLNLTNRHVHAQLVDRGAGRVILATHTTEPDVRKAIASDAPKGSYATGCVHAARYVGETFAQRATEQGIDCVYWSRPGRYHGKIKAFIDAVREAGIKTLTPPPRTDMPREQVIDN